MGSKALTLKQAAKLAGRNERAVVRAIESGLLAATRRADGSYAIDADEIERRRADWDIPVRYRRRSGDRPPKETEIKV